MFGSKLRKMYYKFCILFCFDSRYLIFSQTFTLHLHVPAWICPWSDPCVTSGWSTHLLLTLAFWLCQPDALILPPLPNLSPLWSASLLIQAVTTSLVYCIPHDNARDWSSSPTEPSKHESKTYNQIRNEIRWRYAEPTQFLDYKNTCCQSHVGAVQGDSVEM